MKKEILDYIHTVTDGRIGEIIPINFLIQKFPNINLEELNSICLEIIDSNKMEGTISYYNEVRYVRSLRVSDFTF